MLIVSVNIIAIIQTTISIITFIIVTITIATTMTKLGKTYSRSRGGQWRARSTNCSTRNVRGVGVEEQLFYAARWAAEGSWQ